MYKGPVRVLPWVTMQQKPPTYKERTVTSGSCARGDDLARRL